PPKGKVTYVFVVRFKDQTSAEASYKTSAKDFHVSDSDLADVKAAGGTVTQGSATGLGDNSLEAYVSFAVESIFVGFWQNKRYEVAVIATNTPSGDSQTTSKNINGRIRGVAWYSDGPLTRIAALAGGAGGAVGRVRCAWHGRTARPHAGPAEGDV